MTKFLFGGINLSSIILKRTDMKNKFKYLLSNTVVFAIGNLLTKLIMLLLMPLYTSKLTAEQYGIAELLNNSIEVVLPIATLCIIDAVFRFSIDDDADYKGLLSTAIDVLLKSYVVVLFLCIVFNHFSGYDYIYYFFLLYVATTFHKLFSQFARGIGHIKRFVISGIINALILVIANIILLVFFDKGVKGYLTSLIVSHFIAGIFSLVASKAYYFIDRKNINRTLLKSMLFFSIPNIPNMLSWWINNISSRYIILGFCGVGTAGLFTAASKLPSMIHLFSTIFQQAWQYSTSKEIGSKDSKLFFTDVFKYYSSFVYLVCSGLILISPYLAKLVLKGEFYDAWVYVPLLLLSATIGCFSTFFGTFYTALKNNVMAMISTGIGAIVNILMNLLLVPYIGVKGALIASVVSYLVITMIRIIDTKKYVSIKINYFLLVIQFIIILIQAIVLTLGNRYIQILSGICFISIVILNIHLIKNIFQQIYYLIKGE